MRTTETDREEELRLVRLAQQGDRGSFSLLIDRHFPPLHEFLFRSLDDGPLAERLACQVFREVEEHLRDLSPDYRLGEWLLALGGGTARKHRLVQERLREGLAPGRPPPVSHPVASTLRALPDPLRETLILVHYLHLSYEATARVLEAPVSAIRRRLHQARREAARLQGFPLDFPCRRLQEELDAHLDGELEPFTVRPLGTHLSTCVSCRKELALLKELQTVLDRYPKTSGTGKPSAGYWAFRDAASGPLPSLPRKPARPRRMYWPLLALLPVQQAQP